VTPTTKETNLADESLVAGLRERDPLALERLLEFFSVVGDYTLVLDNGTAITLIID
jgi:hypothetical protein